MTAREVGIEALGPVLILLCVFVLIVWTMRVSWTRMANREATQPYTQGIRDAVEAAHTDDRSGHLIGTGEYVATTVAGQPLQRIHAYGVAMRSPVHVMEIHDDSSGLAFVRVQRIGRRLTSLLIPVEAIDSVILARGIAGKWMGKEALTLIRWHHGQHSFDTGVLLHSSQARDRLLEIGHASRPTSAKGSS